MGYPRVPDAAAVYVNTTDPCRAVCWRAALHDLAMRLVDRVVRHRDARVPKEALVGLDARVRHAHHLCRIALQHGALHNLIACCTLVCWLQHGALHNLMARRTMVYCNMLRPPHPRHGQDPLTAPLRRRTHSSQQSYSTRKSEVLFAGNR